MNLPLFITKNDYHEFKDNIMNIVVTGSLGNISKPLTKKLVKNGHSVCVISSNHKREKDIEAIGARAAIGNLEVAEFLTSVFTGADAVYCMIPLNFKETDLVAYFNKIANNFAHAIQKAGIKQVAFLSGWVAGVIDSYNDTEKILNELPDVSVTHIRPGYFYSNFFDSMDTIKEKGFIAATFGGEDRVVFSDPSDIADAIVDEMIHPRQGKNVRYVASDEMTCNEAAKTIGKAIGKPDLKWVTMSVEEMQRGLETIGLSQKLASDIVQMQAPIHQGLMPLEFSRHKPEVVMGKVKLTDFVKSFATVYNRN